MSYLALYREWRPRTFDEVVEQKHVVYALRQAVISGQIAHAYLFSGTRGTGKTTLAKIFARAVNCPTPQNGNPCNQCEICRGILDGSLLDVVEMDAASNNSVDNIRRITDEVNFMPARARYKVYIIDEVHMLTPGAFNALLKTLEEPPAHAIFILATTEPHRIPATILSRCQRYDFRRIPVASIVARLREIARADQIAIDDSGLETIAAHADGALRDAISLLDQARMSGQDVISRDTILALTGLTKDDALLALADALIRGDAPAVLDQVNQLVMAGRDLARLLPDLALLFRNILICQVSDQPEKLVQATADSLAQMRRLACVVTQDQLLAYIRGLSGLLPDLRWAADTRTILEVGLLRLICETVKSLPAAPAGDRESPATSQASQAPARSVREERSARPTSATDPATPAGSPAQAATSGPEGPLPDEPPPPEEPPSVLTEPPPAEPPPAEQPDPDWLWQKVLDRLYDGGQMTLYLFGRSARISLPDARTLQILFASQETVQYDEFSSAQAQKTLRETVQAITGQVCDIRVLREDLRFSGTDEIKSTGAGAGDQPDWISKLKNTAETFGIPMTMED